MGQCVLVGLLGVGGGLVVAIGLLFWTAHRSLSAGRALLARGQGQAAARELTYYLRFHPRDPQGWMLLAQAQANQDDLDGCLHSLRQIPADTPQGPEARLRIGEALQEVSRVREAEPSLKESIELCRQRGNNSLKLAAQSALLNVCLLEERWEEAEELLWDMYRTWPPLEENARPLLVALLGLKFNRTPPEVGASRLEKIVKQDPDDDLARRMLGKYYVQLGRSGEGKTLIKECVSRHPEDVTTRTLWIWCLYELGDPEAATEALRPLSDGWQDRVELWTYRARAHSDLGQWNEAIECCRQALARDAFDRQAHFQLARSLRRIGQIEESQKHNQTADALRHAEEKRLELFEDVTVARRSRGTPEDCRRFAELCKKTGMHRLAREWARFALATGDAPSMELLQLMPLEPAPKSATILSNSAASAEPARSEGVGHAQ